jgi:nicotinate-nucleotide adenylyltransferase
MPTDRRDRSRLGILGGTFDPPHLGHVAAAVACRSQLALDRVLFVVANDPWQKSPVRRVSTPADRLAMVEAAVASVPGAEVSRLELDRGGPSYTFDTVAAITEEYRSRGEPDPEQFLIVGADLPPTLDTWHRASELAALVTLAVVARPGVRSPSVVPGWRFEVVNGVQVDVSSSQIRRLRAAGRPISDMVPPAVEQYIAAHDLYAVAR